MIQAGRNDRDNIMSDKRDLNSPTLSQITEEVIYII